MKKYTLYSISEKEIKRYIMEYVLKKNPGDIIKYPLYYMGCWTDTDDIKKAKKYTLDDAMEQARTLKQFGEHYIVVRVN